MSSIRERALDFKLEPKFKTERKKTRKKGGESNALLSRRRNMQAEIAAMQELKEYFGEISPALTTFTEPYVEFQVHEVVFEAKALEIPKVIGVEGVKKPGFLKRSGKSINSFLLRPGAFPRDNNAKTFIRSQYDRVRKFARTLKHKGKLNPKLEEILEV